MSGNTTYERREPASTRPHEACEASRSANPVDDAISYVRRTVRENPETAALWCLGIGFVLGWKLKPW
mgnify:CR=1 FL=1|jgi:hypothetical protein